LILYYDKNIKGSWTCSHSNRRRTSSYCWNRWKTIKTS